MTEQQNKIIEYLENSYSGAKMMHDEETMLRCSRAIAAFRAKVYEDIFKEDIFNKIIGKINE